MKNLLLILNKVNKLFVGLYNRYVLIKDVTNYSNNNDNANITFEKHLDVQTDEMNNNKVDDEFLQELREEELRRMQEDEEWNKYMEEESMKEYEYYEMLDYIRKEYEKSDMYYAHLKRMY